jgi:cell division protein ZapB
MHFSNPENSVCMERENAVEARDFTQLGLDFATARGYSNLPRKEGMNMNQEIFEALDRKVGDVLDKVRVLKEENTRLAEENARLLEERDGFRTRIDAILGKLDGI